MHLLDHTCDIQRPAALGTNGRRQQQTLYSGVSCLILPMNQETTIRQQFSLGRGYTAYFETGTDIKIGDRLVWNGSNLIVRAVQPYVTKLLPHVHVMCEQEVS